MSSRNHKHANFILKLLFLFPVLCHFILLLFICKLICYKVLVRPYPVLLITDIWILFEFFFCPLQNFAFLCVCFHIWMTWTESSCQRRGQHSLCPLLFSFSGLIKFHRRLTLLHYSCSHPHLPFHLWTSPKIWFFFFFHCDRLFLFPTLIKALSHTGTVCLC